MEDWCIVLSESGELLDRKKKSEGRNEGIERRLTIDTY